MGAAFTAYRIIIRPLRLLAGLTIALLVTQACGAIVQFVPVATLTPASVAAVPQEATNTIDPTAPISSPSRIVAEAIGLDAPVVEMGWRVVEQDGELISEWEMPNDEAAWHRNSARPGQGSNIVISGHNESSGGQVFAEVEELQVGDEITLWNDKQETFVYQVIEKNIVRTFAISAEVQNYLSQVTEPTASEQLTLITCWPRWTNTHRLIVIAEPKHIATSSR